MSGDGAAVCPVCEEVLLERSAKCFRCDTKLENWWPLEEILVAGRSRWRYAWGIAALAIGLVAGAFGDALWWIQVTPVETPAVMLVSAAEAARVDEEERAAVYYRVQKGDCLWRVAAALTGRGADWIDLWPEYRGREQDLMPGSLLEIPVQ